MKDTLGRENRQLADKPCSTCGKNYRPLRSSSKFCSRKCLWANNGGQNKKPETWWTDAKGYIQGRVWIGDKQIRVKKHRWIMESHLGRTLLPSEDVHHKDGNKKNNALENLEVIDHGQHTILTHTGRRKVRATIAKVEGK